MKIIKSFLGSAILGVLALAALHLLRGYTGVSVPVCRLSLATAAMLGVPGVTAMVLFQLF